MRRITLVTIATLGLAATLSSTAQARAVEFYVGGGGGYEWFDLRALHYDDLLSVDAVDADCDPSAGSCSSIEYSPQLERYEGSSFIYDVYVGVKILTFVLAVDYRGSHTKEDVSFSQLMGEFTFFIPTPKVKPFIRLGVGYVWMTARIADDDPEYDPVVENLRARGLGARLGGGVDFRLVKFFSFGIGVDCGFLYFSNDTGKSFGLNVDLLGRITFHV
jgi:opacity protein-like surface antigen